MCLRKLKAKWDARDHIDRAFDIAVIISMILFILGMIVYILLSGTS